MIHPSKIAEDYIVNKFCECYLSKDAMAICSRILQIQARLEHRPIVKHTAAYRKHLESTLALIDTLVSNEAIAKSYEFDFESEKSNIWKELHSMMHSNATDHSNETE